MARGTLLYFTLLLFLLQSFAFVQDDNIAIEGDIVYASVTQYVEVNTGIFVRSVPSTVDNQPHFSTNRVATYQVVNRSEDAQGHGVWYQIADEDEEVMGWVAGFIRGVTVFEETSERTLSRREIQQLLVDAPSRLSEISRIYQDTSGSIIGANDQILIAFWVDTSSPQSRAGQWVAIQSLAIDAESDAVTTLPQLRLSDAAMLLISDVGSVLRQQNRALYEQLQWLVEQSEHEDFPVMAQVDFQNVDDLLSGATPLQAMLVSNDSDLFYSHWG